MSGNTFNIDQISVVVSDTIPPSNYATVDDGNKVGTVYKKEQDNEWRKEVENTVKSGIIGVLKPNTPYDAINYPYPKPWAQGDSDLYQKYDVKEPGEFPDAKNDLGEPLEVTLQDLENAEVQIWIKNGVAEVVKKDLPRASNNLRIWENLTSSDFPIHEGEQVIKDNIQYIVAIGQAVNQGDVPGISPKWFALDGGVSGFDREYNETFFTIDASSGFRKTEKIYIKKGDIIIAKSHSQYPFVDYYKTDNTPIGSYPGTGNIDDLREYTLTASEDGYVILTSNINYGNDYGYRHIRHSTFADQKTIEGLEVFSKYENEISSFTTERISNSKIIANNGTVESDPGYKLIELDVTNFIAVYIKGYFAMTNSPAGSGYAAILGIKSDNSVVVEKGMEIDPTLTDTIKEFTVDTTQFVKIYVCFTNARVASNYPNLIVVTKTNFDKEEFTEGSIKKYTDDSFAKKFKSRFFMPYVDLSWNYYHEPSELAGVVNFVLTSSGEFGNTSAYKLRGGSLNFTSDFLASNSSDAYNPLVWNIVYIYQEFGVARVLIENL